MKTALKLGLVALALGLVGATAAEADTILQEPFDYTSANITGQNGGDGFSAAWVNPETTSDWRVAGAGLSYSGIVSAGKAADSLLNNRYEASRTFDTTGLTGDGNMVWFSFLYNIAAGAKDDAGSVSFFGGKDGWGVSFDSADSQEVRAMIGGTVASSGVDSGTVAVTHVVVGKITFSDAGNDTVAIWLDDITASGAAHSSVSGDLADPTGEVYLNAFIKGWDVEVDELRLGTTLGSVMPEPATLALLGLGGLALVLRRRRT